ncbi:hypothetical protein RN001_007107 [Aquatica leii]|uniref:Chitin-binding type-2 domain-containing protein n=1 Tax=Aquatica leii TaxID=1421715 RepID=A0AAN7PCN6_9COLE|nr:hypothetical protein RN001_007107 [Aquatica leii]
MHKLIHLAFVVLFYSAQAQTPVEDECPEYAQDSDVVYFPHEDCPNLFYMCNHQDKILMTCYHNLVFDVNTRTCNWNRNHLKLC